MNKMNIIEEMISGLPEPVKKYLRYTGVVGSPWIASVRLTQVGRFRQGIEQPWMGFKAEEFYTTDPPGFRWNAKFKMFGLPLLKAEDKYEKGHGRMYGKLLGLKTIFDEKGEKLDQACMVRYLNEMMWFPTAFLNNNIRWEELDDKTAQVKFTDNHKEVEAQMHFDDDGRLKDFKALRYRENAGEYSLDQWSTPITSYGEFAGLKLPKKGLAVWHLPDGDLPYIELEIKEIAYKMAT
jgi:hypothetical protein